MRRSAPSLAVFLAALALFRESALAGVPSSPAPTPAATLPTGSYATGDWGGVRPSLESRGIVFNLTYTADTFGIVSGGIRRGVIYNGLADLGVDIDLERLVGWNGAHFHVNAIAPHGADGSANYVGDIGTFSNIEAYDTFRLYECWLEQDFWEDRFSLRAGQITFDSEFALLDAYGGIFIHSGFGTPVALSANLPLAGFPTAAPGMRLRFRPAPGFSLQAAIFDGNPAPGLIPDRSPHAVTSNEFNRKGTHWALRPDEGALIAGEISYRCNQMQVEEQSATNTAADSQRLDIHRSLPAAQRGLAGSYEAGFLYHTDEFADIYDTTLAGLHAPHAREAPRNRGANYALYVNLEQEVWREPRSENQGLGAFVHAAWMPPDRNLVDFSIEGGLHYRGPIRGRDDDAVGLGIAWLHISDRVARAAREAREARAHVGNGSAPPDYEATIELVYRYQASPWLSIQPHAQYVLHPGGSGERDNALILGLRTNIAF